MQRELYSINKLPLFQNKIYASRQEALTSPVGDVVLVQDMDTGLIFNAAFDPSLLVYDMDYQNEQACSVTFQHHLAVVSIILKEYMDGMNLLEVGCGKGYFLEFLKKQNVSIQGVDPAYEGNNPDIIKKCFSPELKITAEGIILRHVLEHMVNPVEFLHDIANANGNKGLMYIEVPCFDWICRNKAWFDIFYEHVNYFRITDFYRMFGTVLKSGNVFGGQYIYAIVDLATLRSPIITKDDRVNFPVDFLSAVDSCANLMKNALNKNIVWGSSSKGVIFSIYMQRKSACIDVAVDINPEKQKKYLAVSGLCVQSPNIIAQKMFSYGNIFIMNSNYSDEIIKKSNNKFNYIEVDKHEF